MPGFVGQPTTFNGFGSLDPDGNIERYDWSFGDGDTQANGGPSVTHTYTAAGSYTATLTVTDDEGCSNDRIFTGKATLCNAAGAAYDEPPGGGPGGAAGPGGYQGARDSSSSAIDPARFAVDKAGTPESPVALAQKGTTFRYSLDEAARVVFTVERKLTGRVVRGQCVRQDEVQQEAPALHAPQERRQLRPGRGHGRQHEAVLGQDRRQEPGAEPLPGDAGRDRRRRQRLGAVGAELPRHQEVR